MSGKDLYNACSNGKVEDVKSLIKAGADINWVDGSNWTGSIYAAYRGHAECLLLMAQAGADLNKKSNKGESPAYLAAMNNHLACLEVLFMFGVDLTQVTNAQGDCAEFIRTVTGDYHSQCVSNNTAELRRLCANRGIPDKFPFGLSPLHVAAYHGSTGCVEILLEYGCDVDGTLSWSGLTATHIAAMRGHGDIVALLVGPTVGADVAIKAAKLGGKTASELATGDAKAYFNNFYHAPVFDLSRKHLTKELKTLLESTPGVVNTKDPAGYTPLHVMCGVHGPLPDAVVFLLLQQGADVNATDKNGMTPLHTATKHRRAPESVMRLLMKHGADVNAQDSQGNTPLHYAVWTGKLGAARMLIEDGRCDVDVCNHSGVEAPYHVHASDSVGQAVIDLIKKERTVAEEERKKKEMERKADEARKELERKAAPIREKIARQRKRAEEVDVRVTEFQEEFEEAMSIRDKEAVMIRARFTMEMARHAHDMLAHSEQELAMVLRGDV